MAYCLEQDNKLSSPGQQSMSSSERLCHDMWSGECPSMQTFWNSLLPNAQWKLYKPLPYAVVPALCCYSLSYCEGRESCPVDRCQSFRDVLLNFVLFLLKTFPKLLLLLHEELHYLIPDRHLPFLLTKLCY